MTFNPYRRILLRYLVYSIVRTCYNTGSIRHLIWIVDTVAGTKFLQVILGEVHLCLGRGLGGE